MYYYGLCGICRCPGVPTSSIGVAYKAYKLMGLYVYALIG